MDDFEPENVARQVKPLEGTSGPAHDACRIFAEALQGNDKLEEALLETVNNTEKLNKLRGELGKGKGDESNG